jgi:hypothetical protein
MSSGETPDSKVMSISNWRVNGAYPFGWMIKEMYDLGLWQYEDILI